jgi:hypothetical protein
LLCGVAQADVETGLVAYYPLEEGEGTVAANAVQGTIAGDANLIGTGYEWVAGKVGDFAILFKAVAGTAADCGTWNPSATTGQLTVAVWVKWEGTSGGYQGVVSKRDSWTTTDTYWSIEINQDTSNLAFFRYDSYPDFGTNIAPVGEWQHVVVTYDGTTTTMYLDGAFIRSSTAFTFGPKADAHVVFGAIEAAGWNPFNGTIDEVRIYDRALTADDVIELYNWTGLASAGPDQRVTTGDRVTLEGIGPADATFTWEQISGQNDFAATLEPSPNQVTVQFNTPARDIGFLLTFRMTASSPTKGTAADEVSVYVLAPNPPKLAPSNFRVLPLDLTATGFKLGFRVEWDPLVDAEEYEVGLMLGGVWILTLGSFPVTFYETTGMTVGETRILGIRAVNQHGTAGEDATAVVSYKAMRNLARPAGPTPPSAYEYVASRYTIGGMNDENYDDSNDSRDGLYKEEDFWGYLWGEQLFFDHIAYHTGDMFADGGWFLDLKLQYTQDGTAWMDAPIVKIEPTYDFTDQPMGKDDFARYDIKIPTLRGRGIRIAGAPGGALTFTSISELEVFGLQTQGPLIVQGIDAEYPEGATARLNGSLTFSTAGPITSYQWTGPLAVTNPTSAIASFQAPHVATDTLYVFSLEASDGTNTGTDDDVRILVKNVVTTAVAGPDQSVEEGTQGTLDGSGSLTTTGDITYLWTQIGGTNVNVSGKTTETVSFTAPMIWAYEEPLTFRLDVSDGASGASSDEVVVTVRNALAWPTYPVTYPPTTSYLQNMLHLGTNSTDRLMNPESWGNMTSGFDPLEPFGGVRNIRPYPGLAYDFAGLAPTPNRNPLVWKPVFSSSGIFDNGPLDYFQMHYSVYILSPADRDVRWHVRNDDEVRVFCNGAIVLSRDEWDGAATGTATEQTDDGYVADGTGLKKGINVITGWYEEGEGGAYFAVGVTDLNDERFDDLLYSFGPSLVLTDAYASRSLPTSFGPGATVNVDLAMKVNPTNKPTSVIVSENIPTGIPPANVSAPGATIGGGKITWNLTGAAVQNQTLSYSLTVPTEGVTDVMDFVGTLTFGTTTADIFGENAVYPIPTAPRSLSVEMLQAAHLRWAAPATAGVVAYNVYRSVNGGPYEFIGTTTSTSYVDKWVVPGDTYAYEVSAVNQVNDEGTLSRPTAQVSMPTMEIRQAEDFNYDSGQYPWTPAVTLPAIEAPDATTIGTPQEYDYYHPATGGPDPRTYRPLDNRADGTGVGIEIAEEVDDPGVFHTNIGWIDAGTGSWYRYTFNVPQAGWVKFEFRVATPNAAGMIEAYWDEVLVGTVSFNTGNWQIYTWALMEDEIQTTAGVHTLRVKSVGDGINLDTIAIQWNAAPPTRQSIWEDNFDSYTATADVFSPTNGKWTRGNTTNTAGSWTLWDTAGPPLNAEPANIAGMEDKFMISDSDLSGAGVSLDEEMLSPEVDCTDWTNVRLNFNKNYRMYDDPSHQQIAEVDIRMFDPVSGWSNWTNLLHLDTSDVDPTADPPELSDPEVFDLSAYDGKKIQLKFHFFDAEYDYWFAVDKIRVSGVQLLQEIPLPEITLVAGNVTVGWDPFAGQYSVEYTANLKGTWTKIAGPFSQTSFTEAMRADKAGYYRILGH